MPIVNYAKAYRMFRLLIGISLLCSHHWCQLAAVKKTRVQADNLGFRPTILENIFFYKFLGGVFSGNTRKKSAGVYKGISMVYFGDYMYCTNNMFTVLFFNGSCTSNMFMVLQVVVLWLYMNYTFCIVIYLITKIYVIGGWGGLGLTSTVRIWIVLL